MELFETMRLEEFPNESSLPANRNSLMTQAAHWLREGLTAEDIGQAMEEGFGWLNYQGEKTAPNNLNIFKKWFEQALAKRRQARGGGSNGEAEPYDWSPGEREALDRYHELRNAGAEAEAAAVRADGNRQWGWALEDAT